MSRVRWFIADRLDRLPGFCWANLVTWALGWHTMRERGVRQDSVCRADFAANGVCYCGKLKRGGAA